MNKNAGFTLIELMIVIVILGVLSAIALPNFIRMKRNAERASCVSNQRHIYEEASLYVLDNNVINSVFNVTVLEVAGYTRDVVGECPTSNAVDYDDYQITVVNQRVTALACDIEPAEHAWTPPGP